MQDIYLPIHLDDDLLTTSRFPLLNLVLYAVLMHTLFLQIPNL